MNYSLLSARDFYTPADGKRKNVWQNGYFTLGYYNASPEFLKIMGDLIDLDEITLKIVQKP